MDNPTKNEADQEQTEDLLHHPAWKGKQSSICMGRPHNKTFLSYSTFWCVASRRLLSYLYSLLHSCQQTQAVAARFLKLQFMKIIPQQESNAKGKAWTWPNSSSCSETPKLELNSDKASASYFLTSPCFCRAQHPRKQRSVMHSKKFLLTLSSWSMLYRYPLARAGDDIN